MNNKDTKLKVSMEDHWLEDGEMWVTLNDCENGKDSKVILAVSKNATSSRKKAIKKLKKVIATLEEMDQP